MSFKESDKLVCVDDSGFEWAVGFSDMPKPGKVYVCRGSQGVARHCHHCNRSNHGIYLVGIQGPGMQHGEVGFCPNRFRKLDDMKADIALARSLAKLGRDALAELDSLRFFKDIQPDAPWKGKT